MQRTVRTFLVGMCVVTMTIQPALACHYCGGGWGGGHRYSGRVYYGPVMYGGGCGGCNGCGYEVVVDDCCGGCSSCGTVVSRGAGGEKSKSPTSAPRDGGEQKSAQPTPQSQPSQPATVDRPIDNAPAPELPATPPSQPEPPLPAVETPPPTPPSNDLFNAPAPATPAAPPAEAPAAAAPAATPEKPADDLFGTPATPADPAAPAEKPAEQPATTPPAAADDLFGTPKAGEPAAPAETPATPEATKPEDKPAEKPADNPEDKKKADDIFGAAPSVLREAGGLASDEMREWVDNTGSFSCRARLVRFLDGQVRLVKENGRTTTVPLARLSAGDLEFVNRQASAQQAGMMQTAQAISAMPWISN